MIDLGFYVFYALLFVAVAATIIFPILHMVREPKALLQSAIGIGALLVLFGVSYALSGSEVNLKAAALGVTETTSKLIGAGLIMFYITLALSAVALLYSEISNAIK
jgi:hypothetical protein